MADLSAEWDATPAATLADEWDAVPAALPADPVVREAISRLESGVRGGLQGASLGWSDEAAALADAALPGLSRGVNPDVLAAAPAGSDFATRRAAAEEYYRLRNRQAARDNPGTYLAGELAGGIGTAAATPGGAAKAGGLLRRALSAAGTGAAVGAASGLGHAEGNQAVADTLTGAGAGALMGAASTGVGPALQAASRGLRRAAVSQGRKALTGVGNPLSAKAPLPDEAVEAALDAGAVRLGGSATGAARRLDVAAGKAGDVYEGMLNDLEAAGVEGPVIAKVAERLRSVGRNIEQNAADTRIPAFYRRHAAAIERKAPGGGGMAPGGERLGLEQARQIRARLQREAPYGAAPGSLTEAGAAKQDVARILNELIDEAVTEQSRLDPEQAARFEPLRRELANLLKAREVAQAAANKEAKRKSIGLLPVIAGVGGGAAGGPIGALAGAVGMGLVDKRGASTLSALARRGAQAAGAAAGARPQTAAMAAGQLEPGILALIRALRENETEAPSGP